MAASTTSPADVLNQALVALGVQERVGNLYDGSMAAQKALDIYSQTRDEVLRVKDWPFALKGASGALNGAIIIPGWARTYTYPTDCIRVRYVAPGTIPTQNYDPQPILWSLAFSSTGVRVIVAQITPVTIFYTAQVTDPALWEPLFTQAVVQSLAVKLGPAMRKELAPLLRPEQAVDAAANADDKLPPNDAMRAPPQQQQRAS